MTWRRILFGCFLAVGFILGVVKVTEPKKLPEGSKTRAALVAAGFNPDKFHAVSTAIKEGEER